MEPGRWKFIHRMAQEAGLRSQHLRTTCHRSSDLTDAPSAPLRSANLVLCERTGNVDATRTWIRIQWPYSGDKRRAKRRKGVVHNALGGYMSSPKTLAGVGGWLAFLVAGFIALGPLVGAARMLSEFQAAESSTSQLADNQLWISFKIASWGIFAVTAAISVSAGIVLNKIYRPSSVGYAIACLWVIGPIGNFAYLVAAVLTFGEKAAAESLPETLGGIIGAVIVSAIWTAYLLLSKRVSDTYYSIGSQVASQPHIQADGPAYGGSAD